MVLVCGIQAIQYPRPSLVPFHVPILGFHFELCSKSGWGSTSFVLMLMLYLSELMKMHVFAAEHKTNAYLMTAVTRFRVDPH